MNWFEDETFWRELYPYLFHKERMALAAEQARAVVALADPRGRAFLDLCCGPGRHAVEFAMMGYDVTGVDRSPFLLERARRHARAADLAIDWVEEDMRRFVRPGAFDAACNLFTSFGYFDDPEEDLLVLRNVCQSLREGAAFVIDVIGKERLARTWENCRATDFPDGATLLMRPFVRADWCRVENVWTVVKPDGVSRTFRFEHTIYSGRELKERLLAAGFREVRLFGNLAGIPYDQNAERLVAVARK